MIIIKPFVNQMDNQDRNCFWNLAAQLIGHYWITLSLILEKLVNYEKGR